MSNPLRIKSQGPELPSLVQHPEYVLGKLREAAESLQQSGIANALFKIGAFPERALKYGLGIDAYFSEGRRWSFSEIGKNFNGIWKDNPLTRFRESPGFLLRGVLEALSGYPKSK